MTSAGEPGWWSPRTTARDPALIRPDTRLLNELNLGSLRTTQLLTDAATALGRQSPAAWGAIADLTVAQVIETVEALPPATIAGVRPWLGCFTEALVPATIGRWQPTEHVYLPDATDIESVLAAGAARPWRAWRVGRPG